MAAARPRASFTGKTFGSTFAADVGLPVKSQGAPVRAAVAKRSWRRPEMAGLGCWQTGVEPRCDGGKVCLSSRYLELGQRARHSMSPPERGRRVS